MNDNEKLDQKQKRLLNKYILEGRLNGSELNDSKLKNYIEASRKLDDHKSRFQQKVDRATNRFSHVLTDPNTVRDFPSELLRATALDRYVISPVIIFESEKSTSSIHLQLCSKSWSMEDHSPAAHLFIFYGTLFRSVAPLECLAGQSCPWIQF